MKPLCFQRVSGGFRLQPAVVPAAVAVASSASRNAVGQPFLAAAGFQPAPAGIEDSRRHRKSRHQRYGVSRDRQAEYHSAAGCQPAPLQLQLGPWSPLVSHAGTFWLEPPP